MSVGARTAGLTMVLVSGLLGCGDDAAADVAASSGASSASAGAGGTGGDGGGPSCNGGVAESDGTCAVAAGDRILALEVDPPVRADYTRSLDAAVQVGVSGIPPTLPWALLEPTAPMNGAPQYQLDLVQAMNLVYAPRGLHVMLTIPTLDTVSVLAPPDLAADLDSGALGWDDPVVLDRFTALLDVVVAAADPELDLAYVLVGNEVDVYLKDKPDAFWNGYKTFIDAAKDHLHAALPRSQIGVNVTYQGIADPSVVAKVKALVADQDAVFVSYYLGGNDVGGAPGSDLLADVDAMVVFAGARSLVLKEFGYATGTMGHSPEGQVDFVRDFYRAWDAHADAIPYAVMSRMFDGVKTDCEAQAAAYGFPGDAEFIAFLCTLGLRTVDDGAKPGWKRFVDGAAARGFGAKL